METIENIQEELKTKLSEKRYNHSLGVAKKAKELAVIYGIDENIAELTGLVHDVGKEISDEEKLIYVKENNIEMDEIEEHNVGLLHAKIGADIAKKKYGFTEDMQKAIQYHTTAHPDMNLFAKIIFIADKVEENRQYDGVEKFRKLAEKELDECMLVFLDYAIKKNIEKEVLVHPDSILTRNQLLLNK